MKNWYIKVTEENIDTLDRWRKTKCSGEYCDWDLSLGYFVLSKHYIDDSFFWCGDEDGILANHPDYQKIDLETFLKITTMEQMPDFTVKGTELPVITERTEYRVLEWRESSPNCHISQLKNNFISYGNEIFEGELYVLAENHCYAGKDYYMFKLSDIQNLWKEQNLKTETMRKERCIDSKQAQSIINIACTAWKPKLAKLWANDIVLNNNIVITEEFYQEMRTACTAEQNVLFDKIFGKNIEFPKDGTPCLVKDGSSDSWILRYSNGRGEFYNDGKKSGHATSWGNWVVLDMGNLPVNV